jgi:hypothetical protein
MNVDAVWRVVFSKNFHASAGKKYEMNEKTAMLDIMIFMFYSHFAQKQSKENGATS